MTFTQPCFIRKNSAELRGHLTELGYIGLNTGGCTLDAHNYDGKGSHQKIDEGKIIITTPPNHYGVCYSMDRQISLNRVDCGTNEELFKAIAALNSATDYMQWFVKDGVWFLCDRDD